MRPGFMIYFKDCASYVQSFDDAQLGALFRCVYGYAENGELPQGEELAVSVAFGAMRVRLDDDADRYSDVCQKRRAAASARWDANAGKSLQKTASDANSNSNSNSKSNSSSKSNSKFIKPSLEELRAYCSERGNRVDPQTFMDFYESKGWKVGRTPMKDWRAAVRNWERSEQQRTKAPAIDFDYREARENCL